MAVYDAQVSRMPPANGRCASDEKPSRLNSALSELQSKISALDNELSELCRKLVPVLGPGIAKCADQNAPPKPQSTNISDQLGDACMYLDRLIEDMNELKNRLEL